MTDPHPVSAHHDTVESLLASMTVQEKAAQLGSYWHQPGRPDKPAGDAAPMESAMHADRRSWQDTIAAGLGQLTRTFGTEPVTVAQGVGRLRERQAQVVTSNRHRIPALAHEECLTGFTALGATVYPAAIAWGATFDPDLVQEMAAAIGRDMRSVGVHQGLSPLLDVVRDYRWGRVEETIGEDPYLVGTLGTAYVKGLQSAGVLATLKHFAGYAASRAGRNHAPVAMGTRELEDVILPPFEMAVREGGAASVMNSYSDIDNVPVAASRHLLTHVLRDRWGFQGTVVSDYWSVTFLDLMHRVVADSQAAGVLALTAGMDVELPGTGAFHHLADAVERGLLDEELVDRAARRVLRQKGELGLLDEGWSAREQGSEDVDLDSPANRELAGRVAQESIVLLHNDAGVLPLRSPGTLTLIGPCAAQPRSFMGCYSFPNHVLARMSTDELGVEVVDLATALAAELTGTRVRHEVGVPFMEADRSGIEAAVTAARDAEVAVVAVGDLAGMFGQGTSGEGCDVESLRLPGVQEELVEAVLDTGTPTVLVVVSGRPYALGRLAPRAAAVVQAFMPGEEGGPALAGVLSGRVNPSGKLPVGIPDHAGGQPGTYLAPPLGWFSDGVSNLDPRPLYHFGHGLSYTTFAVQGLELDTTQIAPDGTVVATTTVTNTGDRAGKEVVQLYAGDPVGQVVRPLQELVGFAKVALEPGDKATVSFQVHADRFSFTGLEGHRIVEPGEVTLHVGSGSDAHAARADLRITGEVRTVGEGRVLTTPVTIRR
jgi:beta-xylosidase